MALEIFNPVAKLLDNSFTAVVSAAVGHLLSQGVNKYVKELSAPLSPLNTAAGCALFVVVDSMAYRIFRFVLNPRFGYNTDRDNDIAAKRRTKKPTLTVIRAGITLMTTMALFNRFHSDFNRLNLMEALSSLETTVTPLVILTAVLGAKVIKYHVSWMNV